MAHMRHLVSMERDDDAKLDHVVAFPAVKPDFPPNLRLALTRDEFEKLGLDPMVAEKGGLVHGHFMGEITDVSHNNPGTDEHCCRVEVQITHLCLESEDEENEENEEGEY